MRPGESHHYEIPDTKEDREQPQDVNKERLTPVISALWEAKVRGSLEPRV